MAASVAPLDLDPDGLPWADEYQTVKMRAVFNKFDADGGGSIDTGELREAMNDMGKFPSDEELAQLVKDADKDGSGTVNFQEYCAMLGYRVDDEDGDEAVLRDCFKVFDRDGYAQACIRPWRPCMIGSVPRGRKTHSWAQACATCHHVLWRRSGFIERHELKQIFGNLGTKSFRAPDEGELDAFLKEADSSGDGKIDYHEFVKVMLQKQGAF